MDQLARILLRMSQWVQNPPPRRHVIAIAIAVGMCLLVVALDWSGFWPDALRRDRLPRIPFDHSLTLPRTGGERAAMLAVTPEI